MQSGYVYLICDPMTDNFKIGVTRDLKSNRLKKLQTGNSSELFVHTIYETQYPFRLETMLHSKYKSKNTLNEWFKLDVSDVIHFKETCSYLEKQIECLLDNPFFAKDLK